MVQTAVFTSNISSSLRYRKLSLMIFNPFINHEEAIAINLCIEKINKI
jgi:hypothetical protein